MASDASHVLEDALERMDYIIAGSKLSEAGRLCLPLMDPTLTPALPTAVDPGFRVLQLAEGLRAALEGQGTLEDQEYVWSQVSINKAHGLLHWLQGEVNQRSPGNTETYQERLTRLEGDKESLVLQVSVLTDQVEAQGAKISDLESSLEEHQHKLNSTEEMLQQELVNRASLESQKENLMGEVSYLKVKLGDMEEKHNPGLDRHHKAESVVNLISELQEQMCRFQQEINSRIQEKKALEIQAESITQDTIHTDSMDVLSPELGLACNSTPEEGLLQELRVLRDKVGHLEDQKSQYERRLKVTKAEISDLQRVLLSKNAEIESLHSQLLARPTAPTDSSEREEMYRRRLNNKYEELHRLRKGMDSLLAANDEKDRRIEELTLLLSQCRQFREGVPSTRQAPPAVRSLSNGRTASSSSEEEEQAPGTKSDSASAVSEDVKSEISSDSSSLQIVSHLAPPENTESRTRPLLSSSSVEDLLNGHAQKSPKTDCRAQTLPAMASLPAPIRDRDSSSDTQSQRSPEDSEDGDSTQKKAEKPDETTSSSERSPTSSGLSQDSGHRLVGSPEHLKNNRSIRKFWGKLRRTQSGGLQALDTDTSQFRRGGLRSTAGPRLTRTPESGNSARDLNIPFGQWTREQVCGWLEDFGLGQYVNLTRHWVDNGQTLLAATPQDLEKEMGMKHPLHRKKLQLALKAFANKVTEKSTELDHIWVTRWLDDIGLPQYKDQFHEARVDGRMIQYLTVNDLLSLKVTSQLHHLSVKCAIHVLHANRFNPHCLRRRPGEEKLPSPSEVVQWSNHRVMEWLRAVDLAEYAPNLRGSGVHGGLIILEPRFSSETLALLLNIPPQKTLLRRHLATAFATLVGTTATQEKREYANATGHVPLTTTAKVRPKKLGFTHFSHLRKRRPDESADYICPIDSGDLSALKGASPRPYAALRGLSPILDREAERQQQVGTKS